ncbi:bifunctional riboflavin kinase/FAD synthetase [Bacteroidetes/Chlorobi group bacterium Naka2016]|jgi:riboflavin kinase/FMN adenylyltransferase|nr:MAG: bifunctional riboflavin kinase/FAD synthetase [Bacteroidetes/Chlorobi group bacterium Naka2016]
MEVFRGIEQISNNSKHIITVGTFDGVHLGHQKILNRIKEIAKIENGKSLIITFDPHPQFVVKRPEKEPIKLLTTIEERLLLFEKFGIDKVLIIPFTKEFAQISAEAFVREILHQKVGFSHILVGHDHFFGKNREGNFELLSKLSNELGFFVERIPAFITEEITVSSTKIRNALLQNQIELANKLLGYHYFITGTVVSGDGRGASLGFPTANIKFDDEHKLVPSNGVYLVYSNIDGKIVYGMANLGFRPTFHNEKKRVLEVYYLNFAGDLYKRNLKVHFLKFLRNEQKFNSIDELLIQLNKDKEHSLNLINNLNLKNFF